MLLLQSENAVDEEKSRSVAAKAKELAARRAENGTVRRLPDFWPTILYLSQSRSN